MIMRWNYYLEQYKANNLKKHHTEAIEVLK